MRPSPFLYQPTRQTQPYRANTPQMQGPALTAMTRGRTLYGWNPQDLQRQMQQARPGSLWWHLLNLSAGGPTL